MSDNNERDLVDEQISEDIDSVLSGRRKSVKAENSARPSAPGAERRAPVQRIQGGTRPDGAPVRPRQNAQGIPTAIPVQPRQNAQARPQGTPAQPRQNAPQGTPVQQARRAATPPVQQEQMPHAAPVRETEEPDDDIRIARKKTVRDKSETRVTDVGDKVPAAKDTEKKSKIKKKKKKEEDVGGSIVSSLLKTVIYLVTITVIAVVISIFIINVGNDVFAFVKSDELVEVTVPEDATREDIADILYDNGVINYKTAFKLYGSFKKIEENFVAGDYTVSPSMNYKQLYNAFKEKPLTGTQWVTIPEGFTVDEIIDLMLSYKIGGTKEDYVKAINEGDFSEYWFVKELDDNGYDHNRFYKLEGYLFPDTYEFYNASDAYTVVKKMVDRFDEVYGEKLKARADELGMTTDQVVILASIIEKEAGSSSDFRNVSSVFHNRLAEPYNYPRFESDATVVYAIAHERGVRPKEITAKMLEYNSPYNSYTNDGYPPGAIANPGMNALKYALYPADTNYYYFVSFPDGETAFASSYYEHEQNVARLREMQGQSSDD